MIKPEDKTPVSGVSYFEFVGRKKRPATSILDSSLKQMISEIERIPREYHKPFKSRKRPLVDGDGNL